MADQRQPLMEWAIDDAVARASARLALARALYERSPLECEVELQSAEQAYVDTWWEANQLAALGQ